MKEINRKRKEYQQRYLKPEKTDDNIGFFIFLVFLFIVSYLFFSYFYFV